MAMITKHIFTASLIPYPAQNGYPNGFTLDYAVLAGELDEATQDPEFAHLTGDWVSRYREHDVQWYGETGEDFFCNAGDQDNLATEHVQDAGPAHPYDYRWESAPNGIAIARVVLMSPNGTASAIVYANIPAAAY